MVVIVVGAAVIGGACGADDTGGTGDTSTTAPPSGGAVLHLLDPATGEERWAAGLPGGWSTSPVVVGDRVLVQVADDCRNSDDTTLVALDASSGATVWTAPSATGCGWGSTAPLVTSDGAVVVDDGLRGLDLSTGEQRWTLPEDASRQPLAVDDVLLLVPAEPGPTEADGAGSHAVQLVDGATGELGWTSTDPVVGGTLGGGHGLLVSLRIEPPGPVARVRVIGADDGVTRWTADLPYHERITTPVVGSGAVVVSMSNGIGDPVPEAGKPGTSLVDTVVAFAPESGQEQWRHEYQPSAPGVADGVGFVTPAAIGVDADRVYELRPGVLEAFGASDGTSIWTADVEWSGESAGTVALARGDVVALEDRGVLAVDARTGAQRWTWDLSTPAWRVKLGATDDAVVVVEWGEFVEPPGD